MVKYIIMRIIWLVVVFFAFTSLLFVAVQLIQMYRYSSFYNHLSFSEKALPLVNQYFAWVKRTFIHGDWGVSTRIQKNVPVFEVIRQRLPLSLMIAFSSYIIYVTVGFFLGFISAINKNGFWDSVISIFVMVFASIPSFVFLFLLMLLFAYHLDWLPTQFLADEVKGKSYYLGFILPIVAVSVGPIADFTRIVRGELTESINSEYMVLARTKGLTKKQALLRHALRVSLVPIIPTIILFFVSIISGSLVIELVYSIPGVGRIYFRSLEALDYNLLMALTSIYTFISLFAALLIDLTYVIVDPRIRIGMKKSSLL